MPSGLKAYGTFKDVLISNIDKNPIFLFEKVIKITLFFKIKIN